MDCRIDVNFRDHDKTRALRSTHGQLGEYGVLCLFLYAARCCPDGILRNMSPQDIAEASGYRGDAESWFQKLVEVKFIDALGNGTFKIHNWEVRNAYAATRPIREAIARKGAAARWGNHKEKQALNANRIAASNATSINDILYTLLSDPTSKKGKRKPKLNAKGNAPAPSPAPPPNRKGQHKDAAEEKYDWRNDPHPMTGLPECKRCHTSSDKQTLDLDDQGICCMCRRADEKTH